MNWYHQYIPGDMWDYDEAGSHILFDATVGGQPRQFVTHAARNGFLYSFERANGQTVMAKPHQRVAMIPEVAAVDGQTAVQPRNPFGMKNGAIILGYFARKLLGVSSADSGHLFAMLQCCSVIAAAPPSASLRAV